MTDRDTEFDYGRSTEQKKNADVLRTSGPAHDPQVYLVEYPDGTVTYEPATPENVALFEDGLYEELEGTSEYTLRGFEENTTITLHASVEDGRYVIEKDGREVVVPDDRIMDVIDAVKSEGTALDLYDLYEEITEGQVDYHTIDQFLDRFPDDRVEVTTDGWVIDDTFIVTYDAENYLVENDSVYVRQGDTMVEADERKQAIDVDFDIRGPRTVNGITLGEDEQQFLATVETLLYPVDYLGAETVEEIEQMKAESWQDGIEEIASTAQESGFTDPKSREMHSHSIEKHTLSDSFNVTDELLSELYSNEWSHVSVTELSIREDEFRDADYDVFEDVPNDDDDRWERINDVRESAPISHESLRDIKESLSEKGYDIEIEM